MPASEVFIEAKAKAIEEKLWNKAWKAYKNKAVHFGERFNERYIDPDMDIWIFLDVSVYETEEVARRDKCTFGRQGLHGYIGGKYRRARAKSR